MKIKKCRVCNCDFFEPPLLEYENMPKAAQFLPVESDLKTERGVDLTVCQCSGCGLVQLSNEPVPYYRNVIRSAAYSADMKSFRQKQFSEFVKKYKLNGKKILEVGCGRGEYLSLFSELDVSAFGLEKLAESVKKCQEGGLMVERGYIEDVSVKLSRAPFDAFYTLNFLEHLPNIGVVLNGIKNNLIDGAVGLVEVPNFEMILNNKLFAEFIGDHLFYFTKETLERTLAQNGFDVIECSVIWSDYIISAVVRKRAPLDISDFYKYQDDLKKIVGEYLDSFNKKEVAIWGAGHQAFAIMSMLGLAGRIRYVVDSAPFKQGKYTPATHIAIVSPEKLDTDPVKALIVMAGGYSAEVARIVREKYGKDLNVAILREFGLKIV